MIWYLHICEHCGVAVRRSRTRSLKHGEQLAFPLWWVDPQGNVACNTATAVRRFAGVNGGTPHAPERFGEGDE